MQSPHFTLPKVPILLDKERNLCFTNRSAERLRTEQGIDLHDPNTFKGHSLAQIVYTRLWTGLIWEDPELSFDEIRDFILDGFGPLQLGEFVEKINEAMGIEKEDAKVAADPPETR